MKPSQTFGGEEECESNESGWTMYIGSPIEDDHEEQSDDGYNNDDDVTQADREDESDDSMASDASSGPSHNNNNQWGNGKRGYDDDLAGFQQMVGEKYDDMESRNVSENKTLEKQREGEKVEKKEMLFIDGKDKSPVQVGCNVKV